MMEDHDRPPLWPFLLLCALAAVLIDFGSLHSEQHADALIQILGSLQALKPFFWEQDRYGTLVPLLVSPVRSPLANLLVQNFITVFAGLSAPFLLARYLFRNGIYPLVAAVAVAAFLALATPLYRFEFLVDTAYGVPFSLGFAALLAVEPNVAGRVPWSRRLLAVVLAVLAHWVFLAVFLTLVPLVLVRAIVQGAAARPGQPRVRRIVAPIVRPSLEAMLSLIVLVIGLAAGLAIKTLADDTWILHLSFDTIPVNRWPRTWASMVASNWRVHGPYELWLTALILGTLASVVSAVTRRVRTDVILACVAPVAAAAGAFLFMGTRTWVEINSYDYRYSMPSLLLFQMAAFAPVISLLWDRLAAARARRTAYLLSSILVIATVLWSYGRPSFVGVRANLDARLGQHSADAVDAGCTHVAGDYWFVWKTVYHAKLLKFERGLPGEVWGITMRGRAAWPLWRDLPPADMRVGVQPDELDEASAWCVHYGLPLLEVVEKRPQLWICKFKPEAK